MNAIFPILSAVFQATSFTLDKVVLGIRRISFRTYTGLSFPLIFLITLIIFLLTKPPFFLDLLVGKMLGLLAFSILLQLVNNLIFYRALDYDKLGEIQTLDLLHTIPVILFSGFIFSDERRLIILVPALIASLAIIWSHLEHHHFKIVKRTLLFLIWSLITAPIAASISKILLQSWHPISLELVRSGAVALLLSPLFFKYIRKVSDKAFALLIATNVLTSIAWILYYFSYQRSGIVYTILLFSLQPLLVYFASLFFLREVFNWKKLFAFFIVLGSIIAAQVW